jgi:hypothetical protein
MNKNKLTEECAFYSFAKDDLKEAYRSIEAVNRYKRDVVISALIKIAIISYSRPFKKCRGEYNKHYKLEADIIPNQYKELHQKIITYRDQIFAHSDIDLKKPEVRKCKIENKEIFSITYRGFSPKDFLHETAKMKQLINEVLSSMSLCIDEIKKSLS